MALSSSAANAADRHLREVLNQRNAQHVANLGFGGEEQIYEMLHECPGIQQLLGIETLERTISFRYSSERFLLQTATLPRAGILAPQSQDAILALWLLMYLRQGDVRELLSHIHIALRPSSVLILVLPHPRIEISRGACETLEESEETYCGMPAMDCTIPYWCRGQELYRSMLRESGFSIEQELNFCNENGTPHAWYLQCQRAE